MTARFTRRPLVGISQCLLGDRVRYDGGHKRDADLLAALNDQVEWVPVCPEVEAGMGIPREPIQLVAVPDGASSSHRTVRLLGITSREDWTDRMTVFARDRARALLDLGICGFVLKKHSPSCGPDGVPVFDGAGQARADGHGLFALALLEVCPALPMKDEDQLRAPMILEEFLAQVRRRASAGPSRLT